MDETFEESFLVYLLEKNQLNNIRETCNQYNKNGEKQVAYRFQICVNIFDLYEFDAILGDFCLHKPYDAQHFLKKVLFRIISTNKWISSLEDINQIYPSIKMDHLPPFSEYKIQDLSKFQIHKAQKRFYQLEGIIISQTTVTKYTQSTRYFCKTGDCPGSIGQKFIFFHIPGTNETQTVRNDYLCTYCGKCLTEDPTYRVLGEKIIAKLVSSSALSESKKRHRTIDIYARDELVNLIQLGKQYSIIGLPVFEFQENIIVFSLEISDANFAQKTVSIPTILDKCILDSRHSWNFSLTLSFYFGAHIVPCGAFVRLKFFILLCLVCSQDTEDTDEDLPKPLSEIFGIVCFTDSNDNSNEELLTSFTLTSAMGISSFQNIISESFIKQHIQNVHPKKLKFSSAAEQLIQGYFIASRRINSIKSSRKEFPLFAISTLFSLAEAHAKLTLQSEVSKEDALISILLYEESISVRYGRSMLGVKPLYHLKHQSLELYLNDELQKLIQFEKKLQQFVHSYANDVIKLEE